MCAIFISTENSLHKYSAIYLFVCEFPNTLFASNAALHLFPPPNTSNAIVDSMQKHNVSSCKLKISPSVSHSGRTNLRIRFETRDCTGAACLIYLRPGVPSGAQLLLRTFAKWRKSEREPLHHPTNQPLFAP